ncbi:MAG: DUF4435 domain-containing protein [Anaerolineales bacterium]|nr:DUF4435 domain-containing protein [Anaerolineales bacterium]
MPTRIIRPLPPELTKILFELGPRKLVLVEGSDDVEIFRIWYHDRLSQVLFYPTEGYISVEVFLTEILNHSTTKQAYGLIDRDFRSEAEVETPLNDPEAHLFILRRYALENYLLEPVAVFEELSLYLGQNFHIVNEEAMVQSLLTMCRQLKPIIAANWIFWDENLTRTTNRIRYLDMRFPNDDRLLLFQRTAKNLGCLDEEAEQRILEKEALLETRLVDLNSAYTCIDGKRLLRLLEKEYRIPHLDHFYRLLARTIRQIGLHPDIQQIVEQRILSQGGEV